MTLSPLRPGHLNPEAIYPEGTDFIDGLKIAKLTTWTPESGLEVDASSYNTNGVELDDRIDFLFPSKQWICNPVV